MKLFCTRESRWALFYYPGFCTLTDSERLRGRHWIKSQESTVRLIWVNIPVVSAQVPGEWVPARLACAITPPNANAAIPGDPAQPRLISPTNRARPPCQQKHNTGFNWPNQRYTWWPSTRRSQKQTSRNSLHTEIAKGNHTAPTLPWALWSPSGETPRGMSGSSQWRV